MYNILINSINIRNVTLGFIPFSQQSNYDDIGNSPTAKQFLQERCDDKTGFEKLKLMFSYDEFGRISPEIYTVYQSGIVAFFIGAFYGGVVSSRMSYINFIDQNQEKIFTSPMEAKKQLQDRVTISFAKGAFRWGWRLAFFTSSYVLTTTSIATYRGKSGVLEHVIGGALTGGIYKMKMGLAATAVGVSLGACLGAVSGYISTALLRYSGHTIEEIQYYRYKWKQDAERKFIENAEKNRRSETHNYMEMHNQLLKQYEAPAKAQHQENKSENK